MKIYSFNNENIPYVAEFMSEIKPEWWDLNGAISQLNSGIGWYMGENEKHPKGWILCKILKYYRTTEIECLGYDDNGFCSIGKELQPLIEKAEEWSINNAFANMRFTIGSKGLSCHGRELSKPWEELKSIHTENREEYNWFLSIGYEPSGILPNIYGEKYHGILLIKKL